MPVIEPGQKAPAFALPDQHGKTTHSLSDYKGRPVVLYFYPKDDTSGCTKEACAFQDRCRSSNVKAAVLGVSILDRASKAKFATKYDLSFPLLADEDHAVAEIRRRGRRRACTAAIHGHRPRHLPDRCDGKVARRWEASSRPSTQRRSSPPSRRSLPGRSERCAHVRAPRRA